MTSIAELIEWGIDRVVLGLTSSPMEVALRQLEQHVASVEAAGGQLG